MTKEELLKKFEEFIDNHETLVFQHLYEVADVFGFFYAEIEARENIIKQIQNANIILEGALKFQREQTETQQAKISRLESTLEAADELVKVLSWYGSDHEKRFAEAMEKYIKEKSNLK